MTDLKNVIEHLQIIRTWAELDGKMGRGMEPKCCLRIAEWVDDALEMLKAQQPRVMTLEEVIAHYSLPPIFVDDLGAQEDYYEDIQPLYFEFPHDRDDPWIVHWRGHSQVARYLDGWKDSYNKKWRCWTDRPTAEQREAEPWKA